MEEETARKAWGTVGEWIRGDEGKKKKRKKKKWRGEKRKEKREGENIEKGNLDIFTTPT